jgi:hypothetical protein
MKHAISLVLFAVLLGLITFGVVYRTSTEHTASTAASREGELQWLKEEYHLSSSQFAAVRRLYEAYLPGCEKMYQQIASADQRADRLIARSHAVTPEVDDALAACAHIEEQCRRSALAHVYAVAEQMTPADGARYVAAMRLRILVPGVSGSMASLHPSK